MNTAPTWFDWEQAVDHPVALWITVGGAALLAIAPLLITIAARSGRTASAVRDELWTRYRSWLILGPLMVVPILLGAFWTITGLTLLSLLCIREFVRMTGGFRERRMSAVIALGTLVTFFAVLDHWYGLFVAAFPLTVAAIAIVGLSRDEPNGYIQRVALAVMGYALFGAGLAHLAYFANASNYRPILLVLIVGTQLNDVFAYCCGKLFGRRKLAPRTSPNKTWAGAIGAALLTSIGVAALARGVFGGTRLEPWPWLVVLGLMVSVLGQLGDLMLSAIKRDVGVKDTGQLIPGHGGLLDRFDSLLIVAPACFHYINYMVVDALSPAVRVMTGP